jgi:hypothetical protein
VQINSIFGIRLAILTYSLLKMSFRKVICCFYFFIHLLIVHAQSPVQISGGTKVPYIIEGKDTIPIVNLPIVNVTDYGPDYMKNLQAYYRLRFNVVKVYPYARLAAIKINELNTHLSTLNSNKERKKYTKEFEKQLRKDFQSSLENLSINQGKIFIKLVDRETGHTSYDMIKDLKGSFNAFVFQTAAKVFGHNLKDRYDPQGDDKTIESIIEQIEAGSIN